MGWGKNEFNLTASRVVCIMPSVSRSFRWEGYIVGVQHWVEIPLAIRVRIIVLGL